MQVDLAYLAPKPPPPPPPPEKPPPPKPPECPPLLPLEFVNDFAVLAKALNFYA